MTDQDPSQPKALSGRNGALIAGVLGAAALAGAGVFIALSPSAQTPGAQQEVTPEAMRTRAFYEYEGLDVAEMSERERNWYLVDQRVWPNADYAPASATLDLIIRWREESLRDPDALLDAQQREALLHTLAEHASARAQPTPDAYIELVERDPGMDWNDANELRRHPQVHGAYKAFIESSVADDADALAILRAVWGSFAAHDHLFKEVGVDEEGAVFLVRRLRTVREASTNGYSGEHALNKAHWDGVYYQGGMPFSTQNRTLEQALQEAPSALVVNAHVLVRMGDGRLANWISAWFYDETAERWRTQYMQMSAPKLAKVVW